MGNFRGNPVGGVRRVCERCVVEKVRDPQLAVVKIPDIYEWACQAHAESFWQGACRTASALCELERLTDAALFSDHRHDPAEDDDDDCVGYASEDSLDAGTIPA